MASRGVEETWLQRRDRARSLASFFAAGALVSALAIVLPGWEGMNRPGIAVTVAPAAVASVLLVLLDGRTPAWLRHLNVDFGAGLIAACQILAGGGSATAAYGLLYVWVTLYSALYFSARSTAGHIAVTTAAHTAALLSLGEGAALPPQLALTVGTQVAACLVVGSLTTRLRGLAATDPLTGLANRRGADAALEHAFRVARRSGGAVLVAAAAAWRPILRPGDVLARTGGDEFTVVLPDCAVPEARAVVARLLDATPPAVTCSAGLAEWDGHERAAQLRERADGALYENKLDEGTSMGIARLRVAARAPSR